MRLRWLPSLLLLRRALRELSGIREQLAIQNHYLARLADRFVPQDPETDRDVVRVETGVDFVDAGDQALVLAYIDRTRRDTGHEPTDDEILSYLADEKTVDLHRRLIERDQEIERLTREGR